LRREAAAAEIQQQKLSKRMTWAEAACGEADRGAGTGALQCKKTKQRNKQSMGGEQGMSSM
jgi:hypothetical protein